MKCDCGQSFPEKLISQQCTQEKIRECLKCKTKHWTLIVFSKLLKTQGPDACSLRFLWMSFQSYWARRRRKSRNELGSLTTLFLHRCIVGFDWCVARFGRGRQWAVAKVPRIIGVIQDIFGPNVQRYKRDLPCFCISLSTNIWIFVPSSLSVGSLPSPLCNHRCVRHVLDLREPGGDTVPDPSWGSGCGSKCRKCPKCKHLMQQLSAGCLVWLGSLCIRRGNRKGPAGPVSLPPPRPPSSSSSLSSSAPHSGTFLFHWLKVPHMAGMAADRSRSKRGSKVVAQAKNHLKSQAWVDDRLLMDTVHTELRLKYRQVNKFLGNNWQFFPCKALGSIDQFKVFGPPEAAPCAGCEGSLRKTTL